MVQIIAHIISIHFEILVDHHQTHVVDSLGDFLEHLQYTGNDNVTILGMISYTGKGD